MNKYEKALDLMKNNYGWIDDCEFSLENQKLYMDLLEEKIEFESRKDKLVEGSAWECVVPHLADATQPYDIKKGSKVTILDIAEEYLSYLNEKEELVLDAIEHFILCFKPIEKGNRD